MTAASDGQQVATISGATDFEWAAAALAEAEAAGTARSCLTEIWPDLDLASAYTIQQLGLRRRLAAGQRLVGVKLGLTSAAKQRQTGVDAPLTGWLTDAMALPHGGQVPAASLIHPRVEPEIAFTMGRRLSGPGVTTGTALAAVRAASASLEIIDSRFHAFRFALPDVIADNASAAAFVLGPNALELGPRTPGPGRPDLGTERCVLRIDGHLIDAATGAAVLGHPATALAHAANTLAERGLAIEAGWLVLTGGLTDAVALPAGATVTAEFDTLGTVAVRG